MELVVSHIICDTAEDQQPRPQGAFPTSKAKGRLGSSRDVWIQYFSQERYRDIS